VSEHEHRIEHRLERIERAVMALVGAFEDEKRELELLRKLLTPAKTYPKTVSISVTQA
jgi:hypothetical protein